MILPALEINISTVLETPSNTPITAYIILLQDDGTDSEGVQKIKRTLVETLETTLDAGELREVIKQKILEKLRGRNKKLNYNFPEDRLICVL
jgi:hypothetical protein